MSIIDKLSAQHENEYIARLNHIDEMLETADKAITKQSVSSDLNSKLDDIKGKREELADYVSKLEKESAQHLMEESGPIVMWELVAKELENLLEKLRPYS